MDEAVREMPEPPAGDGGLHEDSQLPLHASESAPDTSSAVAPSPELDPPWSLADLVAFILFAVFSFLMANLLATGAFLLLRRRFAWETTLEQALTLTPFVVSMQTGWELLWLLFIYGVITIKYRRRFWQAIKWLPGPRGRGFYLLAGAALAFGAQLFFNLYPSEKRLPIEKLFSSPESGYLLAAFGICLAPFVEEVVFRGFFYPVFERLWGWTLAVLLSALLFASVHIPQLSGGWQEIAAIFVLGIVFSYFRAKTGSLRPSYLMHLAYNICLFISLYFTTDRFQSLSG